MINDDLLPKKSRWSKKQFTAQIKSKLMVYKCYLLIEAIRYYLITQFKLRIKQSIFYVNFTIHKFMSLTPS